MCVDIASKFLRDKTVLEEIREIERRARGNVNAVLRALIGQPVMTLYNNKIYVVEDIDWDSNPLSTFPHNGGNITYEDYLMFVLRLFLHFLLNEPQCFLATGIGMRFRREI